VIISSSIVHLCRLSFGCKPVVAAAAAAAEGRKKWGMWVGSLFGSHCIWYVR